MHDPRKVDETIITTIAEDYFENATPAYFFLSDIIEKTRIPTEEAKAAMERMQTLGYVHVVFDLMCPDDEEVVENNLSVQEVDDFLSNKKTAFCVHGSHKFVPEESDFLVHYLPNKSFFQYLKKAE